MYDTIYKRMEQVEEYATRQEKAIIDYIRATPLKDMVLLSITEFAENVCVGEATMLRFCKKLHLKGYSEFRFLLSHSMGSDDVDRTNDADAILDNMISALKSTRALLDEEQVRQSAEMICHARRLYAFGSGNSGVAAQEFCNKILRYGLNCTNIIDNHFQILATSLLNQQDVIVLFSVSGSTKDIVELGRKAHAQGVGVIVVTSYMKSPLAKYASTLLCVVAKSMPLNSGSLVSKVSQLFVIDVLSKEVFKQMGEQADGNLRKTVLAIMEKEV